mgnify:CR=1 FL=1
MKKRDKQYLKTMKYYEESRKGDLWYRVIKFINRYENGKLIFDTDISRTFQNRKTGEVWTYVDMLCKAGYLEVNYEESWLDKKVSIKKLHDIPYYISRENFERNQSGRMLWIESEVVFKKK